MHNLGCIVVTNRNTTLMNRKYLTGGLLVFVCLGMSMVAYGQNEEDIVQFAQAKGDASQLITGYITPVIEGLSYGLNAGWFNTAKAHKPLGVDFGFTLSPVIIPDSKSYFDPDELDLETVVGWQNLDNSSAGAPTFLGPDDETQYEVDLDNDGVGDTFFNGPEGLNLKKYLKVTPVLMPMLQLGVGLVKGTDIKIRLLPKINVGNTKANFFGIGLLHDVKQYIPGLKLAPVELSVMGGLTSFKGVTDLSGKFNSNNNDPQEAVYKFNAFIFEALASRKFAVITLYGGIGYNGIKTDANINGNYIFFEGDPLLEFDVTDPFAATFKNNSMRLDGGFRLNLAAFYINGSFTLQEYSSYTLGMGFTVR